MTRVLINCKILHRQSVCGLQTYGNSGYSGVGSSGSQTTASQTADWMVRLSHFVIMKCSLKPLVVLLANFISLFTNIHCIINTIPQPPYHTLNFSAACSMKTTNLQDFSLWDNWSKFTSNAIKVHFCCHIWNLWEVETKPYLTPLCLWVQLDSILALTIKSSALFHAQMKIPHARNLMSWLLPQSFKSQTSFTKTSSSPSILSLLPRKFLQSGALSHSCINCSLNNLKK